ncbi:MAG: hypothetical protein JWM35_418, partial [Verrucomicrobia bacterium]|nr:hypothetical protein [Verrucomicrobiota bacterium]
GCAIVSAQPVNVIRFELSSGTMSYPLSELRHWEWLTVGSQDRLRIRAGPDWIIVTGENLVPLRNALDQLRLQLVRESGARPHASNTQPRVARIELERAEPAPRFPA